jgi:hypothetical protein
MPTRSPLHAAVSLGFGEEKTACKVTVERKQEAISPKGMFGYTNSKEDWRGLNPLLIIFD